MDISPFSVQEDQVDSNVFRLVSPDGKKWIAKCLFNGEMRVERQRQLALVIAASPVLYEAARNTVAYYAAVNPKAKCLIDDLNPCGGTKHWGGGAACPLCSARAAIEKAEGK